MVENIVIFACLLLQLAIDDILGLSRPVFLRVNNSLNIVIGAGAV